jgi:hypothetical protein
MHIQTYKISSEDREFSLLGETTQVYAYQRLVSVDPNNPSICIHCSSRIDAFEITVSAKVLEKIVDAASKIIKEKSYGFTNAINLQDS